MNFAACATLPRSPENGTWYRCIPTHRFPTALQSSHTKGNLARFDPAILLAPPNQFESLSFADSPVVALFEVNAVAGRLFGHFSNPRMSVISLNVDIVLWDVVDLTDVAGAQTPLRTNPQELTGDWEGYRDRGLFGTISAPTGVAPTQELGFALHKSGVDGFRSMSAKIAHHRTLTIFPGNFGKRSSATFTDQATGKVVHHIP